MMVRQILFILVIMVTNIPTKDLPNLVIVQTIVFLKTRLLMQKMKL